MEKYKADALAKITIIAISGHGASSQGGGVAGTIDSTGKLLTYLTNSSLTDDDIAKLDKLLPKDCVIVIAACQQGTATNVQGGIDALEAQTLTMKANLSTAPLIDKVKYEYYTKVISEVRDFYVAPEIALLAELSTAAKKVGDQTITIPQLAGLYNGAKPLFGMCN